MIYTAKLTGSDIVTIIAQHFKVERKAVTLTAHSGFNGGPTDSQAPYVDAEVTLPEPKSSTPGAVASS